MLQICRAEDGQTFQVQAGVRDIERLGSLELFLQQETGVEQDAVLAYLTDGTRLMNANLRELAGANDQTIFVFNKYYLDYELKEVLRGLHVEPPLQPPIEDTIIAATPPFRTSQLAESYLQTGHAHVEQVRAIVASIHTQHDATRIASSNLDRNLLQITNAFEGVAAVARRELSRQAALLDGLQADLDLIARVRIHLEFVSTGMRKAITEGEKPRTLGDYVSNVKMRQVADTCARTHNELQEKFAAVEGDIAELRAGADAVRALANETELSNEAEACFQRAKELYEKITDCAGSLERPGTDSDGILQEHKQLDFALRHEVEIIADLKNKSTAHCIDALRRIGAVNNDLVKTPQKLSDLQTSLRGKNSFSHIQRLHSMLYAYGATVIEIVRRKEFARFFYQRAQSILEVMAKLSSSERKRRQAYRSEVHGQLPFSLKGMDDPVPSIDFSPSGSTESVYSLEREDVEGLFAVLEDLEHYSRSSNDAKALEAVQQCRADLDKLVAKMDGLESGFDRIAERSLLSASRLSLSRKQSATVDEHAYQELAEQLRLQQEAQAQRDEEHRQERERLQAELQQTKRDLRDAEESYASERERADELERQLFQARAEADSEVAARQMLEQRNAELRADAEKHADELSRALGEATAQSRAAEALKQELAHANAAYAEMRALEARTSERLAQVTDEQSTMLANLEASRERGEDLETQIREARKENDDIHRALEDAQREKDRLLRSQASEHDRFIKDQRAEADGDRAVWERELHELQNSYRQLDRHVKDLQSALDVSRSDAMELRATLQRTENALKLTEHDLRQSRVSEATLRDTLQSGKSSHHTVEQELEDKARLVAQLLDVALAFRSAHLKALAAAQKMTAHPHSSKGADGLAESAFSPPLRHSIIGQPEEPSPIDPSDPAAALEVLRTFDHDHFLEAIQKMGSTIRKWQKQCKEYRERAKGKISFRNFAKNDLALFLPTRNSVSKPWAAFNVSFPHYFLHATGQLAQQLQSREWIVARITSITERVVDHTDPTSNPYGLGDGVKYYMLEVEDWTQQTKRRVSAKNPLVKSKPQEIQNTSDEAVLPSGPPEPEVEDTFRVTQSPNSQLFPTRQRTNSNPTSRPSSLSRLLAQASETPVVASPEAQTPIIGSPPQPIEDTGMMARSASPPRSPSPARTASIARSSSPAKPPSPTKASSSPIKSPPPSSPSAHIGSLPKHMSSQASPMRPGSRASRLSSASKFSNPRLPTFGSPSSGASVPKAAPTTALTESAPVASSPSPNQSTPSPDEGDFEGISNVVAQQQRRTMSYHAPRNSPLSISTSSEATSTSTATAARASRPTVSARGTLLNLADSWGMSWGRKKKVEEPPRAPPPIQEVASSSSSSSVDQPKAADLLKKL
ncbi:hypothetical protein GGF50DRAFT_106476 [Schizophyllum commune]